MLIASGALTVYSGEDVQYAGVVHMVDEKVLVEIAICVSIMSMKNYVDIVIQNDIVIMKMYEVGVRGASRKVFVF